jgi:hypothetical protein
MIRRWLREVAGDLLGVAIGEGTSGIPGGVVEYDVRVRWLRDRLGNELCVSCRCRECGARRSLLFPVRRMAVHVERSHR